VREERVHLVDAYELPVLLKTLREETKIPEPSVIITSQPCVLIKDYHALKPYTVIDDRCTGCGNCIDVGCPAIHVTRRDRVTEGQRPRSRPRLRAHRERRLHRLRSVPETLRARCDRPCRHPGDADQGRPQDHRTRPERLTAPSAAA
jgi:NAD-dependent dihydropyrimidine dehydrogenase PreA subunit